MTKDETAPAAFDEFSKHELLDRVHTVNMMFDELVVDHPAAALLRKEIDEVAAHLAALYQQAGNVRFDDGGGFVINDAAAYAAAMREAQTLMEKDPPAGTPEGARLHLLADAIVAYEKTAWPMTAPADDE